jgi:hypothetical protein
MHRLFHKILSRLYQTLKLSSNNVTSMNVSNFTAIDKKITKSIFRHLLFEKTLYLKKGGILEVGVGSGQGLRFFIRLQEYYQDKRQIYAFDSFQGFPEGSKYDSQNFNLLGKSKYRFFSQTFIREFLLATGASNDQIDGVKFIQGFIPESLKKFDNTPIALLNLDLDLYQPTMDSLNYFWKYILPGGVILLDDYDGEAEQKKWPGVKKAVDEFCENNDLILMRGFGDLAYLLKE